MKTKLIPLLAGSLLLGTMGANAIPMVFTTTLSGANEFPPVASTGTGSATITIDDLLNTMRIEASFADLLSPTLVAHIHCCTAIPGTGNIGVATGIPTLPGFPGGVTSGVYDSVFDTTDPATYSASFLAANGGTAALAFDALLAGFNTGSAYLNIHTGQFPGGEIRGFLTPESVPEVSAPGTLALLGFALCGLVFGRRHHTGGLTA